MEKEHKFMKEEEADITKYLINEEAYKDRLIHDAVTVHGYLGTDIAV